MKKLLYTLPALCFVFFFAYCSKSEVKEELGTVNSDTQATNRGGCLVQIDIASASELVFCGTMTNQVKCLACVPSPNPPQLQGSFTTSGVSPIFLNIPPNTQFYVSSATGNTITVTTASGVIGPINVNACQGIFINDTCDPTAN
jgi:hypothetical protein